MNIVRSKSKSRHFIKIQLNLVNSNLVYILKKNRFDVCTKSHSLWTLNPEVTLGK